MHDPSQDDEREAAPLRDLNYVALEGNIGCMVTALVWLWAPWIS